MSSQTSSLIYQRVRHILESARTSAARSVNTAQVAANWLVGREIVVEDQAGKERAGYGKKLMYGLSIRLKADFGNGYSVQNLAYMRQFYLTYPGLLTGEQIFHAVRGESGSGAAGPVTLLHTARGKSNVSIASLDGEAWEPGRLNANLSWTHYRTLLRVSQPAARAFYEIEGLKNHWSARELERQISSLLFERLAKSKDRAGMLNLATRGHEIQKPADVFKDPFVIEFVGLPESPKLLESDLEEALLAHLQKFLMEMGKGFAFVARQKRITLDGDHFYIDLVFYHTVLKCYVVLDLKVAKLTHGDLGQLQLYVNYYDREICTPGDNPTLGLVLCADKNDAVVRYTLGKEQETKIFASRYELHLPSEAILQSELRRELKELSKPLKSSASR